jgi:hypothetical protein
MHVRMEACLFFSVWIRIVLYLFFVLSVVPSALDKDSSHRPNRLDNFRNDDIESI